MRKLLIGLTALLPLLAFSWTADAQEDGIEEVEEVYFEEGNDVLLDLEDGFPVDENSWVNRLPRSLMNSLLLLLAILPAFVLIFYVAYRDRMHPEPRGQLIKAFLKGLLSAPLAIILASVLGLLGFYPAEASTAFGHLMTALFSAAAPEECAKLFILWQFLRKCKDFDEHMDGIVYAVCVGMGFAAVENIMYVFSGMQAAELSSSLSMGFKMSVYTGVSRAFLSVPAHFGFAVLMGYYYSLSCFSGGENRKKYMWMALLLPIAAHAFFDFLLMIVDSESPWMMLVMMAFFGFFFYLQRLGSKSISNALLHDKNFFGNN